MDIPNYDSWKLSSGQEQLKVVLKCDHCDEEIFEGEEYFLLDGESLRSECIEGYVKNSLAERKIAE